MTKEKKKWSALFVAALPLILIANQTQPPTPTTRSPRAGPADVYPRLDLTPGARNPSITQDNIQNTICKATWSTQSIRPPSANISAVKTQIMARYGLQGQPASRFELDRLIPIELGGSSFDLMNLWPQALDRHPGAREKDVVEHYLRLQVCAGKLTLSKAQDQIVADWYAVYLEVKASANK